MSDTHHRPQERRTLFLPPSWRHPTVATPSQTMPSNSKKRAREEAHPEPSNPNAKRKVALLVAYNGAPYQGLQKNPGATTIEEVLEAAIHRAGGITDDNFGTLQKVSWSRAGRTDKGVHAVGQVIGLKCVLSPEPMLDRINAELAGSEVSVLGLEPAHLPDRAWLSSIREIVSPTPPTELCSSLAAE